jgi:ABC-type nitrate/sulfonate/bicarbonate transport system permease component
VVTSVQRRAGRLAAGKGDPAGRVAAWAGKTWLLRGVSILLVLALWEWGATVSVNPAFPTCSETLAAFGELLVDGTFAAAYAETAGPLIVGVLLTGVGGVLAGLVMGLSRRASPSAAIVPLITFVYGIGFSAKVLAVVLLAAPVIVLNSYRGIANTPRSLMEMSNAFLARRWQRIWKVVIPAGSGLIFAGLRLGLAQGFTGAVLAELIITPTGIGDLITYNRSVADYPAMFASILSIILVASVSVSLLQYMERRLFRPELRPA